MAAAYAPLFALHWTEMHSPQDTERHGSVTWRPRGVCVPLAYVGISILMTYPVIMHLSTRVIGYGPDVWVFWWNNWWLKKALVTGSNPYVTPYLFYPEGVNLTYHSFSWLNSAAWLLLEPLLGPVLAYNLTVLWVFPIAGWGMYCLVRDLTGSRAASFLAGLIYAFVPYRLGQINHAILLGTQWIPLYTLYLLRAIREGRWRNVLLAALFFVLTALVGWNLFVYLLIWTAFISAFSLIRKTAPWRQVAHTSVLIVGVGIVCVSPLLFPMLTSPVAGEQTLGDVQQDWMQTDLLAYLIPSKSHPVWGQAVQPLYDRLMRPRRVVYVGYVVMALLGYGLARKTVRQRTALWWFGALLWWLMALGPFLKLGGRAYHNLPLPYYPLSRTYAFQLLKIPDRYNLMLAVPVAVIAGYAAADLLARLRGGWRSAVPAGLATLVLFEFMGIPVESQNLEIPAVYEELDQDPDRPGIVELPLDLYDGSKRYMLYQTFHERPIVSGHVSRRPDAATGFIEEHPVLNSLYRTQEMDPGLTDVSRHLRALSDAGFGYIVIHKDLTDAEHAAQWRDWLTVSPVLEDAELVVYTTSPRFGADFVFGASLTDGIGIIGASLSASEVVPGDTLLVDVRWGTRDAPLYDWAVEFSMLSSSGDVMDVTEAELAGGWPTSEWGSDAVARTLTTLRVDPYANAGVYTAVVRMVDPRTDSPEGNAIALGQVEVRQPERVFTAPRPQIAVLATFGGRLRLLGYDICRDGTSLRLTLHWQAVARMDSSYKTFVHLVDQRTGEMAAQTDAIPRDWSYPTTRWETGEVVSDEVAVDVSSLPNGAYDLYFGAYGSDSGVRLPVEGSGEVTDRLYGGEVVLP